MFTIETKGATRAISLALEQIPAEALGRVSRELAVGAQKVAADAKRAVQKGPATGRVYKRGGVEHQASAPGEAPATDTGGLAGSIVDRAKGLRAEAGAQMFYAPILELSLDRPFIGPAFDANVGDLEGRCRRAVQAVAEAAGVTA